MKTLLLLLVSLPAFAQGTFYGAGLSLLPQSSPKPTGWAAAIITANATQRIYSISEVDFTLVAKSVQTSVRTGAAVWLRSFGGVDLYTLGDFGAATTGATSSGAAAAGAMLVFPSSGTLRGTVGFRILKTAATATETLFEAGLVWGNGK